MTLTARWASSCLMLVVLLSVTSCKQPAQVAPMNGDDPPVIVHGGSFHVTVSTASLNPLSGNQITVPVDDLTVLASAGYNSTPSLNGPNWTMQICNEDPCAHGLVLTATATSGNAGNIVVGLFDNNDYLDQGRPQPGVNNKKVQTDFALNGNHIGAVYPQYLTLTQNGTSTKFTCLPVYPADWTNCRLRIGPKNS